MLFFNLKSIQFLLTKQIFQNSFLLKTPPVHKKNKLNLIPLEGYQLHQLLSIYHLNNTSNDNILNSGFSHSFLLIHILVLVNKEIFHILLGFPFRSHVLFYSNVCKFQRILSQTRLLLILFLIFLMVILELLLIFVFIIIFINTNAFFLVFFIVYCLFITIPTIIIIIEVILFSS